MPESMWSRPDDSGEHAPADWIKSNMFGDTYSADLGRSLTDAEIRFQKCLEQLSVPSWYLTYSKKKPSIRQNCIPFDKRPPTWKNIKVRAGNSPRKSPKKRSPKGSPSNSDSESPVNSRADSGFNETYRISRRTPKKNKSPCISITSSSSDNESDTSTLADEDQTLAVNLSQLNRTPRNGSFTFPRMTPSRKIENINIVFAKQFPPCDDEPEQSQTVATGPRTIYTKTKNIEVCPYESDDSNAAPDETHTTILIADVDPGGVHTRIHVSAGIATPSFSSSSSSSSSDEEAPKLPQHSLEPRPPPRSSPSPHTRFFTSRKKSTALEKIVQRNLGNPRGSLVQDIIGELERSATERSTTTASFCSSDDFVRSMVSALEESFAGDSEDYQREVMDGDLESGSDSELAKSTSISFKSSGGEESGEDQPTSSPLPRLSSGEESEEEVYWIPTRLSTLPRTSSRLSMLSRASGRSSIGRRSPGLSPIRRECPEDWIVYPSRAWGHTYSAKKDRPQRQPLFRIDETGHLDSGYSDTASSRRTAPSRTATIGSGNSRFTAGSCRTTSSNSGHDRYTPNSSHTCSPTHIERDLFNDAVLNKSGPYVLKSFMV